MVAAARARVEPASPPRENGRYRAPEQVQTTTLDALLAGTPRALAGPRQGALVASEVQSTTLYCVGDQTLVHSPCVAVVGTRKVSEKGAARARHLARALARAGVVVVSGLAMGVDTEALQAAIQAGGRVIGVIGTPLDQATPAANGPLQETIYRDHLLVSQFPMGTAVFPSNFPKRNRTMAAISDATAIIEASDTSGTLHQATECLRLGRQLFIARSVTEDPTLTWPRSFLGNPLTRVLGTVDDLLGVLKL